MKVLVLHLSDVHIHGSDDAILTRASGIAAATYRELAVVEHVVIAVTGDIAFSGHKSQYDLATTWLEEIKNAIRREKDIPVSIAMCPGNHDCDFDSGQPKIRSIVVDSIQNTHADAIEDEVISSCTAVQAAYQEFESSTCNLDRLSEHRLWNAYSLQVGSKRLVFHSINVAWMSKKREDFGAIVFPLERFKSTVAVSADCTISLVHHPLNWFAQQSMKPFRRFVRQHSHIVLSGHEHTAGLMAVDEDGAGQCLHLEAPALQEHRGQKSGFATLVLDLGSEEFSYAEHSWAAGFYCTPDVETTWTQYRRLPMKQSKEFPLSDAWCKTLQDPGASFKRDRRSLTLGDTFVFPELRPLDSDDRRNVVDAGFLRDPDSLRTGVMIRGGDSFGKTALLKHLFLTYHELGYVPVYLRGKDLDKANDLEIRKSVERAFSEQYRRDLLPKFWAIGSERRILLLDDIDEFRFPEEKFGTVYKQICSIFPTRKLFTCDETFEFRKFTQADHYSALDEASLYSILEFGHRRRLELVQRWASLGDAQHRSEAEMVALIDSAENKLTAIVGKNIVPSTPLFLLTILQGIEAGSAGDLQNSALGDYYLFLILNSLERQRVPRDQFGEIRNYCSHLSWFLQHQVDEYATEAELRAFHNAFTDKHALTTSYEDRKRLLIAAELLEEQEGAFKFRYPYIDYFFLGQYLHEHIEESTVQNFIERACGSLHRKKNANAILFLSHHSRDMRVYESLVGVLSSQFHGLAPMQLEADVSVMNELVDSIPHMVYEDESVIENRRQLRAREDAADRRKANEKEEDSVDPQNPVVALLTVMKTLEILGQFIKNHYGQLEAETKAILVSELFDASMRGLHGLMGLFTDDSTSVVEHIDTLLKRRGIENDPVRRNEKARRYIFSLLSIVAFSFVRKAAVAVATPNLSRVVDRVVEDHGTNANKLIKMAIDLDTAGGLSLANLQRLNANLKGNAFAQSVLPHAVMLHIHLFKTNDSQKQMIESELNIKMKQQRAVDFSSRRAKRVA